MMVHLQDLDFDITDDSAAVAEDWQRLNRDRHNSLHQSPLWCQAWEEAQGIKLLYLRGRYQGQCYLLLPLERRKLANWTILQVAASQFSNINTGLFHARLLAPNSSQDIALANEKLAAIIRPHGSLLLLSNVPLTWQERQSPFARLRQIENQNQSFQLPLLETFTATLSQLNAKRRRKKFRISEREAAGLGGYQYQVASTEADKRKILGLFFQQKAKRFAAQGLPDVFAPQATQEFFTRLVLAQETIGGDSALELHYLSLGGQNEGRIIAITGISRKGQHCICQFGSIDEQFAAAISPGELLFYHVIEREHDNGTTLFDFGIGDQRYKRSWCPVITVQHDIHISANWQGRLLSHLLMASTKAKSLIKRNDWAYRLIQNIRRQKPNEADA